MPADSARTPTSTSWRIASSRSLAPLRVAASALWARIAAAAPFTARVIMAIGAPGKT